MLSFLLKAYVLHQIYIQKLLILCIFFPSIYIKIPLLDPDEYGESQQPVIVPATYHKTLKPKLRIDRLEGSHEKDPEFISFLASVEAPPVKPISAEQQLEEELEK